MAVFSPGDSSLHKLCQDGSLKKVVEFVASLDTKTLEEKLASRKGVRGYTPLHEAVASGHAKVLHFLLGKSGDVNCRAYRGYTPLHLAASSGHVECVRVLLNHKADIGIVDKNGKTPKQTAERNSKNSIVHLLRSEEIIKEVQINGDNLTALLQVNAEQLEPNCLTRSLVAAVRNDNHFNVAKLIVKGASNIDECLKIAKEEHKPHARAMLLLVQAAKEGKRDLVLKLFGEPAPGLDMRDFQDYGFQDVQKAVLSGKVSTVVPIEMARRNGHIPVREELLLKTDINQEEGTVYWQGLRLLVLDISWLRKIHWVKRLRLAGNGFKTLPSEMGTYLQQVVKLDLQQNELSTTPRCILELPSLQELNLSHNKLEDLPDVPEWSSCLTVLDLSYNKLSSMPLNTVAPAIRALNISCNQFRSVPICICSFTTLHSFDLSDNPKILTLPAEMGRLTNLTRLNLKGLKDLNDPPRNVQRECRDCIRYLNSKLRCTKGFYRMKLMLVGLANRGKTTLVARLHGRDCGDESTVGVDVSEWFYKPSLGKRPYHFSVWDFAGQEEYYAMHQCFLFQRSFYLLLFNLKHGDRGVQELKPWLNNIALRAPRSGVIIVGTHLDEVTDDEREEVDELLQKVGDIVTNSYSKDLQVVEIIPVGLKNRIENISVLKEAIYNHVANYKTRGGQFIMGQEIPASYHALDKKLEVMQQEVRQGIREPIMHFEEFKTMVQQMNLADIQDDDELKTVVLFLMDVGTLLHFDDKSHNLHELYFIDPCWLCNMISKVVTIKERNPLIRKGILHIKDIPILFKDWEFPWQYFEQYLTLLDRFEIALPIDNKRILIPSMLPDEGPNLTEAEQSQETPLYSRYIIFNSAYTPSGFWSRLLSRIMHSVLPQLLPNFPSSLPAYGVADIFYPSLLQLEYWRTGLFYKDPDVLFRIESLVGYKRFPTAKKDGVLIIASPNNIGKKIICQLIDLVLSLVNEWYPGLQDGAGPTSGLEQRVPCYECLKLGKSRPFEFRVEQCLPEIVRNRTTMECGYDRTDPTKNHTVPLADIVPDLLLQDINPEFLLNSEDILYNEDESSLLGKGGYGKVYRGKCHSRPVVIKKYLTRNEDALTELRSEAKLLEKSHHPCVVCLVGVCIHPMMALVMEEAPMGSLEKPLIKKKLPIHRVVIHRMAAEVAAALQFLHVSDIIFRDLKAADVLLWSLDPESLCHCKLTDFGSATHLAPVGARGLIGTKGFIAPEVLYIGKRKQHSVYDHKADIFSFGMFLYQMIARRHPYSELQPQQIDAAVESGERPRLQDISQAESAYHYLTRLMQTCWEDNPRNRPTTEEIIRTVCRYSVQSIMCVHPVRSRFSLRHVCAVTPADFTYASSREIWVCCDGAEGAELNIYDANTMVKISNNFIRENQVQCICLCGDHIWVGSRAGIEYGVIDIFSIYTRELVHSVRLRENSVSCITCSDKTVYLGTLEGYCFSFTRDIKLIQANAKPRYKYVSEHAVDGIVVTKLCVWISHTRYIYFLDLDNLALKGSLHHLQDAFIGQLCLAADGNTVWSAHLGGVILSAWDAIKKLNKFDIDIVKHLRNISELHTDQPHQDMVITAMAPALDTIWVGIATGHVLVFHDQELLTWCHPYTEYVRFIACISSHGPCETEACMMITGAKEFSSPVAKLGNTVDSEEKTDDRDQPIGKAGVLVLWEGFTAKMTRQIKLVEERAPGYLENHNTVREMIHRGEFKDGTQIIHLKQVRDRSNMSQSSREDMTSSSRGANCSYRDWFGRTPLHWAAWNGLLYEVKLLMANEHCDGNSRDYCGDTPLHYACMKGHLDVVKWLIIDGHCDGNSRNKHGNTPLHWACRKGHLDIVKLLITYGCDMNRRGEYGNTPLHDACRSGILQHLNSEQLRHIILEKDDAEAVLLWASKNGHLEVVKHLMSDHHCNVQCMDKYEQTPLHLACQNGKAKIVHYLLSERLCTVKEDDRTLLKLTSDPSTIRELLRHGANPENVYAEYSSHLPEHSPKQPPQSALKIFTVGDHGAGKSTLVKALEEEGRAFSLITGRLRKVTGVDEKTAGIIPHKLESRSFGHVVLYDFAGHKEFYASHAAMIRQSMAGSSTAIFLLLADLRSSDEVFKGSILSWLSFIDNQCPSDPKPHMIIVGSHGDEIEPKDRIAKGNIVDSLEHRNAFTYFNFKGYITTNCCYSQSASISKLRQKLAESCEALRLKSKLSFNTHCFSIYLLDRFRDLEAVKLKEVLIEVSASSAPAVTESDHAKLLSFIPTDAPRLCEMCEDLHDRGSILLLRNTEKPKESWIVLDQTTLLAQVTGKVFAPKDFKEHEDLASTTGIVPFTKFRDHFPRLDPDMVAQFLCHLEFCQEVTDDEVMQLLQIPLSINCKERVFFFPSLVSIDAPGNTIKHPTIQIPAQASPTQIWKPSSDFVYTSGWILQCSQPEHHFTPRFLQVLLLRLAFSFALAPHIQEIKSDLQEIQREFDVWKRGICWHTGNGVGALVEMDESGKMVTVLLRCLERREVECIHLRSAIIHKALCAKEVFCPKVSTSEYFIHPDAIQYPLKPTTELNLFSIFQISRAIEKGYSCVFGKDKLPLDLEKLLYFEPYSHLSVTIVQELFDEEKASHDIDESMHQIAKCFHSKLDYFIKMFSTLKLPVSSAMEQAPSSSTHTIFQLLQLWHLRSRKGSYQCLHTELDRFSVFAGRNPLSPTSSLLSSQSIAETAGEDDSTTDNSGTIVGSVDATILGIESLLEVRTKLREARLAWFNLGLVLGLLQHTLESIHDIGHCLTETLAAWLQGRDGAAAPTWRAIVEALLSPTINFYRLALQISNSHQSNDSRSLMAGNEDPALQDIDNAKLEDSSLIDVKSALLAGGRHLAWFELGLALGLYYGTLKIIQSEYSNDDEFLTGTLAAWLKQKDRVPKQGVPSWNSLARALAHPLVSQQGLAQEIARKHPKVTKSEENRSTTGKGDWDSSQKSPDESSAHSDTFPQGNEDGASSSCSHGSNDPLTVNVTQQFEQVSKDYEYTCTQTDTIHAPPEGMSNAAKQHPTQILISSPPPSEHTVLSEANRYARERTEEITCRTQDPDTSETQDIL